MAYATIDEAYLTITDASQFVLKNKKQTKNQPSKNKNKSKKNLKKVSNFDNANLNLTNSLEMNAVNANNTNNINNTSNSLSSYDLVEPFANPDDIINEYSPLSEDDSDIDVEGMEIAENDTTELDLINSQNNQNAHTSNTSNTNNNNLNNHKNNHSNDSLDAKTNNELTSQEIKNEISEINKKINFILNKINQESKNNQMSLDNNIDKNMHDIILFIIFGAFIILILDSLCRLIIKNNIN